METLNIVKLINESSSATILSEKYASKLLNKIKKNFTISQQQMYVANFYCFLNHDSEKDFIIEFDNVWKWVDFSRKDSAKKLLEKYFKVGIDYKIVFRQSLECAHSGRPSETILLTINCFKKFCLKAGTKKADEVHDYYIKLEKMLNETVNEQTNELMKQLDYQTKSHLSEIEKFKKKLEKNKKAKYELSHSLYIISNPFFKGYFKIGKTSSINNRMDTYTTSSPVQYKIEYLCRVRNKTQQSIVENMVLQVLSAYTVKNHIDNDREWVFGVKLETIKKEMNDCVEYLNKRRDKFDILFDKEKLVKEQEDEEHEDDLPEDNIPIDSETEHVDNIPIDSETEQEDNIHDDEPDDNIPIDDDGKESELVEEEPDLEDNIPIDDEAKESESVDDEVDDKPEPEIKEERKKVSKYDVDLSNIGIKRNNPIDFDQFIIDFCDLNEESHVIQTDIRCAYRIWSKCELDSIQKQFDEYMNKKFKDTRLFLDNQRRHVYKGLKLKPLVYKKTNMNFDFEEFIDKKCEIGHLHRISYNDFFHFFTIWKKETDPSFKMKRSDVDKIKEILDFSFSRARVQHSVNSKSINLFGILGVGMTENNFGQKNVKRRNKKVGEFDINTNKFIKEYDSIYLASQLLNISFSSFSSYIRSQTAINGKYYKLL